MPAAPATGPIAPGVVLPGQENTYPQYGVGGGTPGSSAGWNVVTAHNASEKLGYENQGYLIWFTSNAEAQAEISSESSAYGSGEPQNAIPGLTQIGDFFGRLAEGSTWIRVAEVLIGLGLIAVGLAKLASGTGVGRVAETAAKGAALL